MSAKDMLKGRSPRDPNKKSTLIQAFAQGGGAGIYGDFLINELQNEYGNGIFETVLGPTASDIKKIFDIVEKVKEYLDPGFFRRMRDKHEQQRGQSYYLKP
jgi:hypothetical protein